MQYFSGIDAIFVINLPERTDRRAHMEKQFARLGLQDDPRIRFFPAVRPADAGPCDSRGANGVYLSNLEILGNLATGFDRVLVLEDDCLLSRRMPADAFNNEQDLTYGGVFHTEPTDTKGPEEYGAHCIAYSAEVRPVLVSYLKENYARGPGGQRYIAPFDGQIVDFRGKHPEYSVRIHDFAVQMPSDSDITPGGNGQAVPRSLQNLIRNLKTTWLYYR